MVNKKKEKIIEAEIVEEVSKKKKVEQKEVEEVKEIVTSDNNQKPYFFPRLVAYIIDIFIVSIVCTGILFLIPENKNYDKYMKEYEQIQTDYIEQKIDADEYLNKSIDVVYDIDYSNTLSMIIEVVLIILYFILFQFYNKGQTVGKKLMKLRVVSSKGSLTLNQVAVRSLIINSILVNILIIGSLLFLGRDYYYYASSVIQVISLVITVTTLIMIFSRKDGKGLHDVIAKTQVIQEN